LTVTSPPPNPPRPAGGAGSAFFSPPMKKLPWLAMTSVFFRSILALCASADVERMIAKTRGFAILATGAFLVSLGGRPAFGVSPA
jgi:hypothetical protein